MLLMTTKMVHVRVDEKVKARAERALLAMGLSVSDAVRVLLQALDMQEVRALLEQHNVVLAEVYHTLLRMF